MGRFIFVSFGLLVVFLSVSGTGADLECPSDWSAYDQHCYRVFKQLKTWKNAEKYCGQEVNGSHLASIHSWEERVYVARLASSSPSFFGVWIGLQGKRRNWQWSDGSPYGYQSWKPGAPRRVLLKEYCVKQSIMGYLEWSDEPCWFPRHFVCKFQPQVEGSS